MYLIAEFPRERVGACLFSFGFLKNICISHLLKGNLPSSAKSTGKKKRLINIKNAATLSLVNAFESENIFSHAAETLYLNEHPLTSLVLLIIIITEAETAFVDHTQHSLKSIFPIKFLFSFSPVCFYLVLSTITAVLGLTCGSKAFAEAVALSNVGYY